MTDGEAQRPGASAAPSSLGWMLWAVVAALPWLLPTHSEPWTTFYAEVLMAAALLPVAAWAVWVARDRWGVDALATGFALLAFVPSLQAVCGLFNFPGETVLITLYLGAFALTLMAARQAESVAPLKLADALFASLACAALVSTGLAMYQWIGLDTLGLMVAPPAVGGRPLANVGQPNNLSTLLGWGLIGFWWGYSRKSIGALVTVLAAAFLLFGIALTQSRTGWLAAGLLGIAAVLGRSALGSAPKPRVIVLLALWFVLSVVGIEVLSQMRLTESGMSTGTRFTGGKRPMIWMLALDAIAQRPWLGYGWNQIVLAHVSLAAEFPHIQIVIGHAHNVVLDLLLWNGLPLGALICTGLGVWFWHQVRGCKTSAQTLSLLALGVFLLHSMLELPHVSATFLLPVALMMGTLSALRPLPTLVRLPRRIISLIILVLGGLLLLMFDEYTRIESNLTDHRIRAAHIVRVSPIVAPDALLLRPLESALESLRTEPRRGMSAIELSHLRKTITRYPTYGGLFRYAQACALSGRPEEASWALKLLCDTHPISNCDSAGSTWRQIAEAGHPEMKSVVIPRPKPPPGQR